MASKDNTKLGILEEESLKRKERLKNLRKKAEHSEKKPIFRSYKPQDKTMVGLNPDNDALINIEEVVKDQLEILKTPIIIEDIDIANLAPRKPDWDLKRDVSKKLEKLERRTQKAIAELIRERLKKEQENIYQVANLDEINS